MAFLAYFLCLTKSMETFPAGNAFGGYAALKCRGAAKGFNWHCAKFCLCALIRGLQNLEAPFGKVLILFVRSRHCGELNRGLQNLDSPFGKGFNFVSGKLSFGCAESRFAEPRSSLRGSTILFFSLVRKEPKVPQRFANLWTPGTIQISARYEISAEVTGHHHVTDRVGNRNLSGYRR